MDDLEVPPILGNPHRGFGTGFFRGQLLNLMVNHPCPCYIMVIFRVFRSIFLTHPYHKKGHLNCEKVSKSWPEIKLTLNAKELDNYIHYTCLDIQLNGMKAHAPNIKYHPHGP